MSTDDEFARSLRERAGAVAPAMSVDAAATLRLGRRRVRARHAWEVGSVVAAVGVVAVVIAPMLPASGPTTADATAQVGVSSHATTPRPTSEAEADVLGKTITAKTKVLRHDMDRALTEPLDVAAWDALSSRLDALVLQAETALGQNPPDHAVELGRFPFPEGYTARTTEWIGWADGERITVTAEPTTHLLRMSFTRRLAAIPDVVLPPRGRGPLSLVTSHADGLALDGDVLTYEDADGQRFELDVVEHAWRVTPTAPADLATSGPSGTPSAPSSNASAAPGHTVDVTAAQRARLDSLSTTAMSGATATARATAAENLEKLGIAIARTRHVAAVAGGEHDVVSAGLVPTQGNPTPAIMFVATKHAEWDGWIDGYRAIVTAGTAGDGDLEGTLTTGELRVVLVGLDAWDGYGKPFSIEGTGALTLESESQGVLTLRDAHGATHRFDLATMRWA